MGKTERFTIEQTEPVPASPWLVGLSAWFVPGAGYLMMKKWGRAAVLGGAVWVCFLVGLSMGGHLFDLSGIQASSTWVQVLLQVPPMVANLGTGLLFVISWVLGVGFGENLANAARATYEYGTTLLLIAGLLNYLTMLDAFDIAVGRKP